MADPRALLQGFGQRFRPQNFVPKTEGRPHPLDARVQRDSSPPHNTHWRRRVLVEWFPMRGVDSHRTRPSHWDAIRSLLDKRGFPRLALRSGVLPPETIGPNKSEP